MKLLIITPWYPSVSDPMAGLFVMKMVQAVERYGHECVVISETGIGNLMKKTRRYIAEQGLPDLVHLHVTTKQALVPLWLKRRHNVPYIVTEHYSGFLKSNGEYERKISRPVTGRIYKLFVKDVVRGADAVTAVSEQLKRSMEEYGIENNNFRVLYNVVDEPFYRKYERKANTTTEFLHVSCFDNRAKNVFGIIRAAELLAKRRRDFHLTMAGTGPDAGKCRELATEAGLIEQGLVSFTGELTVEEVAERMRSADCFVLFSNYETAGVVLEEAMTVGMAIISTPVGLAPEFPDLIRLTEVGNEEILARQMSDYADRPTHNQRSQRFADVGREINLLYNEYGAHKVRQ